MPRKKVNLLSIVQEIKGSQISTVQIKVSPWAQLPIRTQVVAEAILRAQAGVVDA